MSKVFSPLIPEDALFKKMLTFSFALHVSLFLVMGIRAAFFPKETIDFQSVMKVDMVDLPDKIKELPQPYQPAQSAITPLPTQDKAISLKKKKNSLDKIKQFEKEEKKRSSIEKIQAEVKKQEALERSEKLKKLLVKGNVLSPGTALHGLAKSEFNEYIGDLHTQIQEHWNLPEWLSNANLKATVVVFLGQDGKVAKRYIEQPSGDARFDNYALKAVDDSIFPAPPEKFRDIVRSDGIRFRFPQ